MIIILTIIFFILDIISKYLISRYIMYNESIILIKDFLNLTYVKNTGAAWSILSNNTIILSIIGIIIIVGIIYYIYKSKVYRLIDKIGYSLLLGGSIGNLFDRIFYGYVRDFIDINIFGYNYPIFNIADSFIVIGIIILIISSWRYKDGD